MKKQLNKFFLQVLNVSSICHTKRICGFFPNLDRCLWSNFCNNCFNPVNAGS